MSRDIRIEFGEKVRKERKQQGLTQEELAHRAHLHFTYIGQVERGKRNPSLINIHRIVRALHISISQIFPL